MNLSKINPLGTTPAESRNAETAFIDALFHSNNDKFTSKTKLILLFTLQSYTKNCM